MRQLFIILIIIMLYVSISLAASPTPTPTPAPYNLATLFGAGVPTSGPTPNPCIFTMTENPITANGVDQSTITLKDVSGNPLTSMDVLVNGQGSTKSFPAVTWPKTVVSNATGTWCVNVASPGYSCSMCISALSSTPTPTPAATPS